MLPELPHLSGQMGAIFMHTWLMRPQAGFRATTQREDSAPLVALRPETQQLMDDNFRARPHAPRHHGTSVGFWLCCGLCLTVTSSPRFNGWVWSSGKAHLPLGRRGRRGSPEVHVGITGEEHNGAAPAAWGWDLNSRSNAHLLNQEAWTVPKASASEGRGWGAEPRAPNRTTVGMGCGQQERCTRASAFSRRHVQPVPLRPSQAGSRALGATIRGQTVSTAHSVGRARAP